MTYETPVTAYIIVADGEVDQIASSKEVAMQERLDLKAMGCRVFVVACPWADQDRTVASFRCG